MRTLLFIVVMLAALPAAAQYRTEILYREAIGMHEGREKIIVRVIVPANTVRLIYHISTAKNEMLGPVGLDTQLEPLLPEKVNPVVIEYLAKQLHGGIKEDSMNVYAFNRFRCVRRFAKNRSPKKCSSLMDMEVVKGGIYDMYWRSTLFKEKYYFCFKRPTKERVQFYMEVVAVIAL